MCAGRSAVCFSKMKPLKRCQVKDRANVLFIDIEDDDDVVMVDSPESSHLRKGESSEKRENRRVSPQSVIRIEDDDDDDENENESYTNHISAHEGEGFAEFESDATSSHRLHSPHGMPREARSGSYRFGNDAYEYEPIEIDSDCEVMEDSSGLLREQWEKAAFQKKVSRHKANFGPEGMETVSGRNTSDGRQKEMAEPFSEGPSRAKANAPFTSVEVPSTFNAVNEENQAPYDQDTLFPEFDWRNLGGRSSFEKPIAPDTGEGYKENRSKMFNEFFSENFLSQHNVGSTSFDGKDQEQCCADTRETEERETGWDKVNSKSQYLHKKNINQAQCSADNDGNASHIHGEKSTIEYGDCDCVFPNDCDCGRNEDFGVEKVHVEEQMPSFTPCKANSNHCEAVFDIKSGDAPNNNHVAMDCEADCEKSGSKETDKELEKLSSSETAVRQDNFPPSDGPLVGSEANYVPEGYSNDTPAAEGYFGIDIINEKEKLKETEEYKRAMEEEWALRQQQLKLQAEEAQRLRKRKKAESLRVLNIEKRQKQRLEEVRASQKQDSANLNMKEQFRSEVIKELKVLEMRSFDMGSLLRSLGVQVEGGAHPSPQQVHGAYKRAVLKFHPDRTSGSSLKQQVEAEEKFKLISRMKEKYKLG